MVIRDARDDRNRGRDDIGRIQPPAEADFKQQHVCRSARKQHKRRHGCHFKIRNRRAIIHARDFLKHVQDLRIRRQLPRDADAFIESD